LLKKGGQRAVPLGGNGGKKQTSQTGKKRKKNANPSKQGEGKKQRLGNKKQARRPEKPTDCVAVWSKGGGPGRASKRKTQIGKRYKGSRKNTLMGGWGVGRGP